MLKTLHLRVYGKVQGVFFRQTTIETALKIGGISGWVRNRLDGSVEVYCKGEEEALERLIAFCRKGSPASVVSSLEVLPDEDNLPAIEDEVFRQEKTC